MSKLKLNLHFAVLFCLLTVVVGGVGISAAQTGTTTAGNPPALSGTWEGRFSSRNFASFPVTIVINPAVGVKLAGAATLGSPCLKGATLNLTVSGSKVVLAGTDAKGDSITFKGTLDPAGTQLTMTYVVNGSASGKCETDDGAGTLNKH
jgi:hypothetical protein